MERAAAIIVGSVGALVLIIGALFWVSTRSPASERGVDLLAAVAASDTGQVAAGAGSVTSSPVTSGSVTAGSVTSGSVTSGSVTSGSVTSSPSVSPSTSAPSVATTSATSTTAAPVAPSAALRALLERVDQGGVRFAYRSAELDEGARRLLDDVAQQLRREPNVRLRIVGHTDSDGDPADNEALSAERARAVIGYLVSQGVAAEQLNAVARGELEPVAPNDSDAGRQANRRSELELEGNGS